MDIGFFHPERGYWQAVEPSVSASDLLATYPDGTIEVPLRPSADHELIDGAWVYSPTTPPLTPVPASITRRQCAIEMRARDLISSSEAIAMVTTATPPAFVETVIAALPEPDQTSARIDFAAGSYERSNPLLISLMISSGASSEDIDAFFRAAAQR